MKFKNFRQYDTMDCGPACLKMLVEHYGRNITLETLRKKTRISRFGVSLHSISEAAEELGFTTTGAVVTFEQLKAEVQLPAIAHWRQNHFVVIYKISGRHVYISVPAQGNKKYTKEEFLRLWATQSEQQELMGIVLILEPNSRFEALENEVDNSSKLGFQYLWRYLMRYKKELGYVALAIGLSSVFQFIFPFLTRSVIDNGIINKDIGFVGLILLGQFALLFGRFLVEFIRSWMLLYVNNRVNVSILSDFLIKLMRLPVSYFDTKMSGDILQRMSDHRRVQDFLTGPALDLIFSMVTIIVLGITLFVYDKTIFLVFIVSSAMYSTWTFLLLKKRTALDFKRFELSSQNQVETLQIIEGMQEIKLNNSERQKRWKWEKIQAKLFRFNIDSLRYQQFQQSGAFLINEGKNLLILFIAASGVIKGYYSLGVMMAIQAIVGQLNGPISLMINLVQNLHDTKLSLKRLNEIHMLADEEPAENNFVTTEPEETDIRLADVDFSYPGTEEAVLKKINLLIQAGKTTAIVGSSGSGKTTLLKVLLKFYEDYSGEISYGNYDLKTVSPSYWRGKIGTVMQDGFIFSDTIAGNITVSDAETDWPRLIHAMTVANIQDFVESLPLGANTKIGAEGMGISQGQRQRILIARAVYKNPDILFFDEATNALDANNESIIIRNLSKFLENKTVIIVAHRLSTVKNADQIIVMDKGTITETGRHEELTRVKGNYYTLVKNQLELGN